MEPVFWLMRFGCTKTQRQKTGLCGLRVKQEKRYFNNIYAFKAGFPGNYFLKVVT